VISMENSMLLAYALLATGIILIAWTVSRVRLSGPLARVYADRKTHVEESLDELGMTATTADEFLMLVAGLTLLVAFLAWVFAGGFVLPLLLGIGTFLSQEAYFAYLRAKRREMFDLRLPMALDQIVSCAKAGMNLSQSLKETSKFAPSPVDEELSKIVREQQLGSDIAASLINARERMRSHTFSLAVSALLINIKQGGDLPKAMEKISQALKEVWRLEQKIFTASAEARKGAIIMSCMPVVILGIVLMMQPEMLDRLTGSLLGYGFITASAMLYVGGLYWMRSIIQADV
jgi:tight adherence protein B